MVIFTSNLDFFRHYLFILRVANELFNRSQGSSGLLDSHMDFAERTFGLLVSAEYIAGIYSFLPPRAGAQSRVR